ncbi:hypothetical protein KIN20_009828 [Parelaphostrongylus tenuis]|uniref:Uncharacterized protein n=1 Tax=Parelaphostrongylus tenuis TaxID=148309 RepID=A0AAD5MY93_PARTN|nr:hypothetical protein KIN20_009828 [Parelaphostrongylus tenuis]
MKDRFLIEPYDTSEKRDVMFEQIQRQRHIKPAAPIRIVDVIGIDIADFDAEELCELDAMFQNWQLSVRDLVVTSRIRDTNLSKHKKLRLHDESERSNVVLECVKEERSPIYVNQENVEVQYESDQLQYEMADYKEH